MSENGLRNITDSPHAPFLRALQAWVWQRFPVHQLSATDIFYALKWAQTGIPADMLTEAFEAWLRDHPHHFDDGFRLTRLKLQAEHAISEFRKKPAAAAPPLLVNDPFKIALDTITTCGRQTNNPLLRDALRAFYQAMREAQKNAIDECPGWNERPDAFYPFKARAILAWDEHLAQLLSHCYNMLSEQEQTHMKALTPREKIHCMHLGEEAKQYYLKQCLNARLAAYFQIESLIENIL